MDKPLRPCPMPGCDQLVRPPQSCPEHPVVTGADRGFYDHEWASVRADFIAWHPYCWCGKPAAEVDHMIPVRMGGARLDWLNLRSLCHHHHMLVTAATRARHSPPRPFRERLR